MRFLLAALALTAATTIGTAQASFVYYGSGCGLPGSPPPLIRFTGLPQLGMSYTVRYAALPNAVTPVSVDQPILVSGLRRTSTPAPMLSALQPPNCLLLTSTEVLQFMPATSPTSFQSQIAWSVPNNPILIGFRYNHQWASLYSSCRPTCTPMMIRVSNAAMMTIGL